MPRFPPDYDCHRCDAPLPNDGRTVQNCYLCDGCIEKRKRELGIA